MEAGAGGADGEVTSAMSAESLERIVLSILLINRGRALVLRLAI